MNSLEKILIDKDSSCQSIWFMRQAGRYLPEFRKIRSQNKNFIDLCLNSALSTEITLQPINRFDLDAAIIFSDILLVPYALGQEVKFIKDKGPSLNNLNINFFLDNSNENFTKTLSPVYKAIEKTREKLDKKKSLIAFVGAPWTLLIYMLNLKNNENKINKTKLQQYEKNFQIIIDKLTDYLCVHIENQIKAGADVVQIFDSWAGLISSTNLVNFCYKPNSQIVSFCKKKKIPVICFPKGLKEKYLDFNNIVKPNGLSLDYDVDPMWAKEKLKNVTLQGGMHPHFLLKPEEEMYNIAKKYLDIFKDVPYIFNLGHGIVPDTDPDKLEKLIKFVRKFK